MPVFSLAGAPLSVSHDATRAVNLLYCRSPRIYPEKKNPKLLGLVILEAILKHLRRFINLPEHSLLRSLIILKLVTNRKIDNSKTLKLDP